MNPMTIDSLAIEVTRRCNMSCAHCMRGDVPTTGNVDMELSVVKPLLDNLECIGTLTFTGGEPCTPQGIRAMQEILGYIKDRGIPVYNFYVVTNGKALNREFLYTMLELYAYVVQCGGEPDMCGLALSKDRFHEPIPKENETLLRGLSFFVEDKFTNFDARPMMIWKGRAAENFDCTDALVNQYSLNDFSDQNPYELLRFNSYGPKDNREIQIELLTVTVNGNLLPVCDYAYADEETLTLGKASDIDWFKQNLIENWAA